MFLCYAESQKSFRRDPVQKDHSEGMNDMIVIIATWKDAKASKKY